MQNVDLGSLIPTKASKQGNSVRGSIAYLVSIGWRFKEEEKSP